MKKYCPLTKEIAFARLDKRLSEEDKKSILKARNMIEIIFIMWMECFYMQRQRMMTLMMPQ